MRVGMIVVAMMLVGCEEGPQTPVDRLCDRESGPWTRLVYARAQCVAEPYRVSTYDLGFMEENCRATYGAALEAGTINVTTRSAREACIEALDANECVPGYRNDWAAVVEPACAGLTWGVLAHGDSCSTDEECDEGSYCEGEAGCGECARRRGIGDACTRDEQCYQDLCIEGTCRRAGDGWCRSDDDCPPETACKRSSLEPYAYCRPRRAIGEPCSELAFCDDNTSDCRQGVCTGFAADGEPCTPPGYPYGVSCDWTAGLICVEETCVQMPVVGEGEGCGDGWAFCADPLECVDGACVRLGHEGDPCDDESPCDWYSVCVDGACAFTDFDAACVAEPAA